MNKFTFGIYKGQTFDEVASTEKGLLYLDKMVDWMKEKNLHIVNITFYNDLCEYVQQPKIAQEIEEAIDNKEDFALKDPLPKNWWEK